MLGAGERAQCKAQTGVARCKVWAGGLGAGLRATEQGSIGYWGQQGLREGDEGTQAGHDVVATAGEVHKSPQHAALLFLLCLLAHAFHYLGSACSYLTACAHSSLDFVNTSN